MRVWSGYTRACKDFRLTSIIEHVARQVLPCARSLAMNINLCDPYVTMNINLYDPCVVHDPCHVRIQIAANIEAYPAVHPKA